MQYQLHVVFYYPDIVFPPVTHCVSACALREMRIKRRVANSARCVLPSTHYVFSSVPYVVAITRRVLMTTHCVLPIAPCVYHVHDVFWLLHVVFSLVHIVFLWLHKLQFQHSASAISSFLLNSSNTFTRFRNSSRNVNGYFRLRLGYFEYAFRTISTAFNSKLYSLCIITKTIN